MAMIMLSVVHVAPGTVSSVCSRYCLPSSMFLISWSGSSLIVSHVSVSGSAAVPLVVGRLVDCSFPCVGSAPAVRSVCFSFSWLIGVFCLIRP
ncbi:hypothetical protein JB92DRAFT_3053377 [Gautieria morchelliformis]|nr:hypothetical protein JB92DRAFT_3053377 [Gautieria morchelliformis]